MSLLLGGYVHTEAPYIQKVGKNQYIDRDLLLMLQETQKNGRRRKPALEGMKRCVSNQFSSSEILCIAVS